jgi:hypothetical protein
MVRLLPSVLRSSVLLLCSSVWSLSTSPKGLLLSVVIADSIRVYRKSGQWKRIEVIMWEGGVLIDPGDTERGVPVGILSATSVQSTGTLKYNLTTFVSYTLVFPLFLLQVLQ